MRAQVWFVCVLQSAAGICMGGSLGEDQFPTTVKASRLQQPNDCIAQAAAYHRVNPWIVRAIIKVESNFDASAVNKNSNGTRDVGLAQINSMHFEELNKRGIAPGDLMNGCVSSYVAAWHLKKQIAAYGNTWFAVGAYHSTTPCFNQRYTALVWNTIAPQIP
jgi:soluble lytic murein transglycosylase-like protein